MSGSDDTKSRTLIFPHTPQLIMPIVNYDFCCDWFREHFVYVNVDGQPYVDLEENFECTFCPTFCPGCGKKVEPRLDLYVPFGVKR